MALTWISIAASLLMGLSAACVFVFAVRRNYFREIEDVKFQVFWSDRDEEERSAEVESHKQEVAESYGIGQETATGRQRARESDAATSVCWPLRAT
jgi:hypothetical protein